MGNESEKVRSEKGSPFRVRITAMRQSVYPDLSERYEKPLPLPCEVPLGGVFQSDDLKKPEGLCLSAWQTMLPFLRMWRDGVKEPIEGWMKDPDTLLLSCNDGFRPMSFLIERMEEEG